MTDERTPPRDADRALVQAVLAGQGGAFARLVAQHQRLVWHVVQRLVLGTEDTRDLCQETFLRVHRQLHQYRFESSLATWIGRVAYSIALRHLEKRRVALVDPADDALAQALHEAVASPLDLEASVSDAQAQRLLHAAIEALPPLPRTLLTLYHLEELSIAEITHITGLPAGTVKSHLFRARARLKQALAPQLGEPP
jgi:RNA polymerase sigma-70 factor (ECF subfamily)